MPCIRPVLHCTALAGWAEPQPLLRSANTSLLAACKQVILAEDTLAATPGQLVAIKVLKRQHALAGQRVGATPAPLPLPTTTTAAAARWYLLPQSKPRALFLSALATTRAPTLTGCLVGAAAGGAGAALPPRGGARWHGSGGGAPAGLLHPRGALLPSHRWVLRVWGEG